VPNNTRYRVTRALNMLRNKQQDRPWKKLDNVRL
jgi:acetyl-CoA carboxylase carboxyltransferase component